MGFEHRGTEEHRGVVAAEGIRTSVRPKPSEFTSESASTPPDQRVPQSPLLHIRLTPNTQCSAENCPYRAKLPGGGLTWHFMPG
jgi:hypothetical protein